MADPIITTTRKIGMNRGKPRLWIEGKALVEAGLDHGNRWSLIPGKGVGFTIARAEDGKRKIAGKPGRPIIDMAGKTLTDIGIEAGDTVELNYVPGTGVVHVIISTKGA